MSEILPHKISCLIWMHNAAGDLLLLRRSKSPNEGLWSPIGGKLEKDRGESPFEAARRETFEETGHTVSDAEMHLWGMIAEKNYEARTHWLMFLFDCRKPLPGLPPPIDEGAFAFHPARDWAQLDIPETDREILWPLYTQYHRGFVSVRADCTPGQPLRYTIEQALDG